MNEDYNVIVRTEAVKDWDRAHQAARFSDLVNMLRFRASSELLSFEEVRRNLRLTQKNYMGVRDVPLDQIRGSVGRYKDFTDTFLPRSKKMRDRWIRVGMLVFSKGGDPVELYQVGEAYFVLDGNHRVSIARQARAKTVQAHVYQFETPVGLSGQADLEEVLIKAEYREFLNHTELKKLRPEAEVLFTTPGNYRELEYQIHYYQEVLEQIDEAPFSYDQAVEAWYDLIYAPAVQIIEKKGMLENFPDRTEADLFIWVWRNHQELRKQGSDTIGSTADYLSAGGLKRLLRRITGKVKE